MGLGCRQVHYILEIVEKSGKRNLLTKSMRARYFESMLSMKVSGGWEKVFLTTSARFDAVPKKMAILESSIGESIDANRRFGIVVH